MTRSHPRFRRGRTGAHLENLRRQHEARAGDRPLRPDERTDLECAVECRGVRRARRVLVRAARRIRGPAHRGAVAAQRARRNAHAAAGIEDRSVLVEGRSMTVAEARMVGSEPHGTAPRRLDRDGHLVRLLGHLLLLVDAVALVVVFAFLLNVDWSAPRVADLVTVLALAVFGAGVQALLAVRLGRRLWAWRHADPDADDRPEEYPPPLLTLLLAAGLLAVLAVFAAIALYVRVDLEAQLADAGGVGRALGLLLAVSALAAPWCVVAQEAYRPAPEDLLRRAAARAVHQADQEYERLVRRSRRQLDRAVRCRRAASGVRDAARRRCQALQLDDHAVILLARGLAGRANGHDLAGRPPALGAALQPWVEADLSGLTAVVEHLDVLVAEARAAHRPARAGLDLAA